MRSYLATRGGAALDMEDTLGSLEAGKLADIVGRYEWTPEHCSQAREPVGPGPSSSPGDDRNIMQVYVDGRGQGQQAHGQRG